MSDDEIQGLKKAVSKLSEEMELAVKQRSVSDKMLTELSVRLEAHYNEEKKYDQTLRNIDDNVNTIKVQMASEPLKRNERIVEAVKPIQYDIHALETEFHEYKLEAGQERVVCADKVKSELRTELKSHAAVLWIGLLIAGGLAGVIYSQIAKDLDTISANQQQIMHRQAAKP